MLKTVNLSLTLADSHIIAQLPISFVSILHTPPYFMMRGWHVILFVIRSDITDVNYFRDWSKLGLYCAVVEHLKYLERSL